MCAIGATTADQLREAGYPADRVPEQASFEALASGVASRLAAEGSRT